LGSVINSYTYFAENDVLLAKITPCFENGKIGIARNLKNGIGFGSSEYIVFRPTGVVIPEYLYFFLSRPQFRTEGKKLMTGAVGHKRISKDWIENYPLPYPKSISTQTEIVEKLKVLSQEAIKLNVLYQKKLETLTDLKDGLLKRAFENELIEAE
jgi:type I restriction enzyme S subunit